MKKKTTKSIILDNKLLDNKLTGLIFKNRLVKSITSVIASNFSTLLISIMWVFVLPGVFGKYQFGLFNVFMLYIANIALLQLGFKEGFVLKYGKLEPNEIPVGRIKVYTRIYLLMQIGLSILFGMAVVPTNLDNADMLFLLIVVAVNIVAVNLNSYYSMLAQLYRQNGLKGYIESIHKLANTFAIVPLLVLGLEFRFLILYFTLTNYVELFYYSLKYRRFESNNKNHRVSFDIREFMTIFQKGIPIMISNFVALVVFTIDRLMIKMNFGTEDFASYLFAGSIIAIAISIMNNAYNYANVYVQRTLDTNKNAIFDILTVASIVFGVITLGSFFFVKFAVFTFLPEYSDSVLYVAILLPALMFRSEISVVKKSFLMLNESQKQNVFITVAILILAVGLNMFFINFIALDPAAIAYASFATFFIWYIAYDIYFTRIGFRILLRKYPYILIMIVTYIEVVLMDINWILSLILFFGIAFIVTAIFYYRITKVLVSKLLKDAKFSLNSSK